MNVCLEIQEIDKRWLSILKIVADRFKRQSDEKINHLNGSMFCPVTFDIGEEAFAPLLDVPSHVNISQIYFYFRQPKL